MRRLLDGTAPLRGRAQLDLMLRSFRFRDAAEFWGLAGRPEVAFRLNALVGGTPAYRDMCVRGPRTVAGFDEWVADRLLDPGQVMFDEGDVLLHQQPELMDPALYFAVLGAISRGTTGGPRSLKRWTARLRRWRIPSRCWRTSVSSRRWTSS